MAINIIWNLTSRGRAVADILEESDVFLDGRKYKGLEDVIVRLIDLSHKAVRVLSVRGGLV